MPWKLCEDLIVKYFLKVGIQGKFDNMKDLARGGYWHGGSAGIDGQHLGELPTATRCEGPHVRTTRRKHQLRCSYRPQRVIRTYFSLACIDFPHFSEVFS